MSSQTPDRCFLCGRKVFGLKGWDAYYDTFLARTDADEDRIVLDKGLYGWCHGVCLPIPGHESYWRRCLAKSLQEIRRHHLASRLLGYEVFVHQPPERRKGRALWNKLANRAYFVREDGLYWPIEHAPKLSVGTSGMVHVAAGSLVDSYLDLSDERQRALHAAIASKESISLRDAAACFGVEDLYSDLLLANAQMVTDPMNTFRNIGKESGFDRVPCILSYRYRINPRLLEAAGIQLPVGT